MSSSHTPSRPFGVTDEQWRQYLTMREMREMGVVGASQQTEPPRPASTQREAMASSDKGLGAREEDTYQCSSLAPRQKYAAPSHGVDIGAPPSYDATFARTSAINGSTSGRIPNPVTPDYGSPFAHNAEWYPDDSDARMHTLPEQTLQARIKQRFARSPGDIYLPPFPSFARALPNPIPQFEFPPQIIPSNGRILADGFKSLYPGRVLAPCGVSAADFGRFLEDLDVAGRLGGLQRVVAGVAPVTAHLGATGYFVTKAIEKGMKKRKEPLVYEVLDMWSTSFFAPRGLDVTIRNNEGLVAADDSSSSSSSSSSSDEDDEPATSEVGGREGRKARKDERKRLKKIRRAEKKVAKEERKRQRKINKSQRKIDKQQQRQLSSYSLVIARKP